MWEALQSFETHSAYDLTHSHQDEQLSEPAHGDDFGGVRKVPPVSKSSQGIPPTPKGSRAPLPRSASDMSRTGSLSLFGYLKGFVDSSDGGTPSPLLI